MYDIPSYWIAAGLFISMAAAVETGYYVGGRFSASRDETSKEHVNTIQASIIGILALLLGFTFSLALQRYDSRSEAVVDEANAIGTTYLRSDLLPAPMRDDAKRLLAEYVGERVRAGTVALDRVAVRKVDMGEAARLQAALWRNAVQAGEAYPDPVRTGLYIQALNDMFDSFGFRNAALDRHVPEVVLFLLYGTFLMAGAILGYASGMSGHRASFVSYIMIALIVLLVFIIIDLDRPRRGIIVVSQQSMIELQEGIRQNVVVLPTGQRSTR